MNNPRTEKAICVMTLTLEGGINRPVRCWGFY